MAEGTAAFCGPFLLLAPRFEASFPVVGIGNDKGIRLQIEP
ncbi:hypothetical protein BN3658_01893 [Coriobacteriaceae bacterium CHKCI002]|nr:hypothetical protein BN3658_01893 [Coriobacteriaceae bacterium CHKCI002]